MRLTYVNHSCFLVEIPDAAPGNAPVRLLVDPFFLDSHQSIVSPGDVRCDYILLSHGHDDHCCEALAIAQRNDALIIANFEIAEYYAAKGARTHGLNPGGGHTFPFGHVKLTPARHSSSQGDPANPVYLGEACGIVLTVQGRRLYHAGDTAVFLDMELIGRGGLDLALLPIGDNYTMGPDDALIALDLLKPKACVPIHYNTWPIIAQDAEQFAVRAAEAGHAVKVLAPGASLLV